MDTGGAPTSSSANLTDPRYQTTSRLYIIITLVCSVVALIALILACYAVGKTQTTPVNSAAQTQTSAAQTGSQVKEQTTATSSKKVWTIAIGHDYGAQEYVNQKGYLAGFNHEVIDEVCKAARIICETVWEPYTNCWDSEAGKRAVGGKGLQGRWYDACTGWYVTIERQAVFQFSQPFLKAGKIYFYTNKTGATFTTTDVTGKKIGFLDGWAYDEKCLARTNVTGAILPVAKIFHYSTTAQLRNAVVSGTVDAAFASEKAWTADDLNYIKTAGNQEQVCGIDGLGMMTRKDGEFNTYWNMGFQKIKNSVYRKLCSDAKTTHAARGVVDCVDVD